MSTSPEIPADLLEMACDAMFGTPPAPSDDWPTVRRALAAILPEHEKRIREQIAKAIEETVCAPPDGHKKCPDCYRYQQMKRDAKIARGAS